MTAVHGLTVAADAAAWERAGLAVVDGESWVGGVRFRFVDPEAAGRTGVIGWTLTGSPNPDDVIDGLATEHLADSVATLERERAERSSWDHPMGASSIDHVVVMTSSLERTCGAIEASTGEPLKRIREAGPVRQGFHRLGPVVVEVVESAQVHDATAAFWGFVLVVDDIDELAGRLGPELVSLPKTAVQPGRRIASFRHQAGLGLPFAVMTR